MEEKYFDDHIQYENAYIIIVIFDSLFNLKCFGVFNKSKKIASHSNSEGEAILNKVITVKFVFVVDSFFVFLNVTLFVSKLDVLCQFYSSRVINGDGRPPHVILPRIRTALSTASRGLFSSKGSANFCTIRGDIDVDNAAVGSVRTDPLKLTKVRYTLECIENCK